MTAAINALPQFWQGVLSSIVAALLLTLAGLIVRIVSASAREWLTHRRGALAVLRQQLSSSQPNIRADATLRVLFGLSQWLIIAALLYAFSTVVPSSWPNAWSLVLKIASMGCLVVSLWWLFQYQRPARSEPDDWKEALLKGNWTLVFNPPNRSKPITFLPDGAIGNGQNNNESSWRIVSGLLELVQADGRVHSRFSYNPRNSSFVHTNDPDTLSIKGQYIIPTGSG